MTTYASTSRPSDLTKEDRKMTSLGVKVSRVTDEEKFREIKAQPLESVGKETTPAQKLYFSDLTEEELMKSFGKGSLNRFESYNAYLQYGSFWKKLKLFGSIEAAEWPVLRGDISPDPALDKCLVKLFERDYSDPLVVPDRSVVLNESFQCSIPFSNNIQIEAKLYVFTDKVDGIETEDDYHKELKEERDTMKEDEKTGVELEDDIVIMDMKEDNTNGFRSILEYFEIYTDRYILKGKEDAEKIDKYDPEFYQMLAESDVNYYVQRLETDDVVNENQLFEICNEYLVINMSDYLSKTPNGGPGFIVSKGKDGYLKLFYVTFKYAVDATLEVEIVCTTSAEKKVAGEVTAYYGKDFDYSSDFLQKFFYSALLFDAKPDDVVKPGKVNLMRSVVAVPAQFSLIIDADLRDPTSKESVLKGIYEFPVPCQGGTSLGSIEGVGFSLKLKVDWNLPDDVLLF